MHMYVLSKPMAEKMLATGTVDLPCSLRLLSLSSIEISNLLVAARKPRSGSLSPHEPAEFRSDPRKDITQVSHCCHTWVHSWPCLHSQWRSLGEESHVCRDLMNGDFLS